MPGRARVVLRFSKCTCAAEALRLVNAPLALGRGRGVLEAFRTYVSRKGMDNDYIWGVSPTSRDLFLWRLIP